MFKVLDENGRIFKCVTLASMVQTIVGNQEASVYKADGTPLLTYWSTENGHKVEPVSNQGIALHWYYTVQDRLESY